MKRLLMLTALVAATATTGCSGTKWRVSGKCQSGQGCQIEGSVEGVIKSSGQSLLDQIYNSGSAVDAASFSIDTSGSTMSVPGNGHVTINLVVASSGATVASATVPWHRVGSAIVLSNPDSVNAWALASGGNADTLTYKLHPFAAPAAPAELHLTSMYEGVANANAVVASVGQGQSCRPVRCHAQ